MDFFFLDMCGRDGFSLRDEHGERTGTVYAEKRTAHRTNPSSACRFDAHVHGAGVDGDYRPLSAME
jgi:hypothetical protein